jgi:hypothetical protein
MYTKVWMPPNALWRDPGLMVGCVVGISLSLFERWMAMATPLSSVGTTLRWMWSDPTARYHANSKTTGMALTVANITRKKPGMFTVDLTVNNQPDHVGKAPYKCKVRAAGDASKSYAKGKGWRYCYDNQPTSFTVYVKDEKGAPVVGEELEITMSDCSSQEFKDALAARIAQVDPYMLKKKADQDAKAAAERGYEVTKGDVPCRFTDNKDGTYTVNYTAIIPGEYSLNVKVNGQPIKDAPKVIKCHWSCPNAPCAHGMEELHQTIAEQRDQIYQLQKKLAAATGARFEDRGYDQE